MELYASWLIDVASELRQHFTDSNNENFIKTIITKLSDKYNSISITGMDVNKVAPIVVIVYNPIDMINEILEELKTTDLQIRPVLMFTKLVDNEFMLEVASNRVAYFIKSNKLIPDVECARSIICRNLLSIANYEITFDLETNKVSDHALKCIDKNMNPERWIIGGKKLRKGELKHSKVPSPTTKRSMNRVDIIDATISYAESSELLNESLIFVSPNELLKSRAMDVIITTFRVKDMLIKFIREHVTANYPSYKILLLNKPEFKVPGDFRLTKFTIAAMDIKNDQITYLFNLYNSGMYEAIPCQSSVKHLKAHPLVQLRILYNDKVNLPVGSSQTIIDRIDQLIDSIKRDIRTFNDKIYWAGFLRDESNARNQENMKHQMKLVDVLY